MKDAPRLDVDETMTEFQEQELWSYYGYDYAGTSAADSYGYGTTYAQARADEGFTTGWDVVVVAAPRATPSLRGPPRPVAVIQIDLFARGPGNGAGAPAPADRPTSHPAREIGGRLRGPDTARHTVVQDIYRATAAPSSSRTG